ncbi:MAG: hypothetical protein Q8L14_12055 [Myxococcales bacterium]|nr:hypothetical protein [Myxococcales bacterium]
MLVDVLTLMTNLVLSWNDGRVLESQCRAYIPAPAFAEYEATGYCEHLRALGELPLAEVTPAGSRSFRLTIFPTWGNTTSVRVILSGSTARFEGRRLQNQAGYELGPLIEIASSIRPSQELEPLIKSFADSAIGGMTERPPRSDRGGKDGSGWLLEFVEGGRWHAIGRWSPDFDTKRRGLSGFLEFCTLLYRLGPLRGDVLNKGTTTLSKEP